MNVDTAIGAAITSLFIAKSLNSEVSQVATAALVLVVLAIYNFDHLVDAKKIKGVAISGRHRFYQLNFTRLAIYQLFLLIALLVTSWYLPPMIAQAGIILAVITLIYFLLLFIIAPNHFAFKEIMIATVFTCGVFLAPFISNANSVLSVNILLLWMQIFLLAMANTLIFSWLDYKTDNQEGHSSLAQIIGSETVRTLSFFILALLAVSITISLTLNTTWINQLIITVMGSVLLMCLVLGKQSKVNNGLRIMGEAIFLIPLIHILN